MRKLYQNVPLLKTIRIKMLERQSVKLQENRRRVLIGYRFLLKNIPHIYTRPLKQAQMQGELQYLFHKSTVIFTQQQADARIKHMQQIISEIKEKDYSSLGSYIMNYFKFAEMKQFTQRNLSETADYIHFQKFTR